MGKMMDLNIIDYYTVNCAILSIITIEDTCSYQIDFGKPVELYSFYKSDNLY